MNAADVERISINMSPRNATILRYHLPQTGLEAKFSVQFALACCVVAGRPGLAELTTGFVTRPDVQALMKRVVVIHDDRDDPNLPGYAIFDQVVIETRDGRRIEGPRVTKVRGGPDLPLSRDALFAKFDDCMRHGDAGYSADAGDASRAGSAGSAGRARSAGGAGDAAVNRELFDLLLSLDQVNDVGELTRRIFRANRAAGI